MTFSCAVCHATNLFGKKIIGLNNKVPRANDLFVLASKYIPMVHPTLFKIATGANTTETKEFKRTQKNLKSVGVKSPIALGLDTSLGQVALSLSKREEDDYATKSKYFEKHPRPNDLETFIADSKPAVWWNLKYKTRWLSDGSIVSGNPIFTNFLWNEIGRGVDLKKLETWLKNNKQTVMELTTAVFASRPPLWTDFYSADSINLESAKRGEKLYETACMKCHGTYEKAWAGSNTEGLSNVDLLKTTKVIYHDQTPVMDVGTDPNRYLGMNAFYKDLNRLKISKWMQTIVEPQVGYVPPPLDGIWARYPYFHNNSIPTLCALLTPTKDRPKIFYQGPSKNIQTDFDDKCVGYPVGSKVPPSWKKEKGAKIMVNNPGIKNIGHDRMLFDRSGNLRFSNSEKMDLIEFLKTL